MADASYVQTSFHGGAWSKTAQGRFDLPAYRTAMNVCLNGIPLQQGAWTRRPGLMFAATTRNNLAGRVISYAFQQNAPYTLEFTDGFLRLYAGPATYSIAGQVLGTVLLLHCDGSNGGTSFTDSAIGGDAPHAITAHGVANTDTGQKKFGTASARIATANGTAGVSYISTPNSPNFNFAGDDFTIDSWVRYNSTTDDTVIGIMLIGKRSAGPSQRSFQLGHLNGNYIFSWTTDGSTLKTATWASAISTGSTDHIELVRSSGDILLFKNGTLLTRSGTNIGSDVIFESSSPLEIGGVSDASWGSLNGWIEEVQVLKAVALNTSDFTPPSSAYTASFTPTAARSIVTGPGQSLVMTDDAQTVLSVSTASPAAVTTASQHGWSSADQGVFSNLGSSCPMLQNRQVSITVTAATTFTITDAITGANIDGSTLDTLPAGATFSRIRELVTPYVGGTFATVRTVQGDDAMLLLNSGFAPQVLSVESEPTDSVPATFDLNETVFLDGPYLDPPTNGALLTPSAATGIIGLTVSFAAYDSTRAYAQGDFVTSGSTSYESLIDQNLNHTPASSPTAWEVVNAAVAIGPNGFQDTDIGRHIRLCNEPALWSSTATYGVGTPATYNGVYYTSLTASNTGNIPGTDTVHWGLAPNAGIWTWGKITGLQNQISNTLSGSAGLGNMGTGAFSGVDSQNYNSSSHASLASSGSPGSISGYVGRDFSGASNQQVLFATWYPSTDFGIMALAYQPVTGNFTNQRFTINLRGKMTAPANAADGTLLGTYSSPSLDGGQYSLNVLGTSPITINSSDATTAWKYVWFEISGTWVQSDPNRLITAFVACGQAKFFGPVSSSSNGVSVQILGPNLLTTSTIRTWRLGLYSGTVGWPTCGTYHEGRIWIAGSVNNRFDASAPNQDLTKGISFAPTTANGTVTDSSAISYRLNAPTTNTILSMKPDQQGIVIYTGNGEWLVQATTANQPLTATNIQAHQMTRIGSSVESTAKPIQCEHTTLFVQRHSISIMEYFADVFSGKFSAPDLAAAAKHLTSRRLLELAYQQSASPIVWARADDGSLLGMSYKRESLMSSQGPNFAGWHEHSLGGDYTVSSIAAGPSPDGTLDTLAAVLTDGQSNHVCFLRPLPEENDEITDAWNLDVSVAPTSMETNGATSITFNGLWHLNGKEVTVWAGGVDCGEFTVADGSVTVPFSGLFTATYAATFDTLPVVVGFNYVSRGQILRPATPQDSGARNGPAFGKKRRTQQAAALLHNTQGIYFGTSFEKLNVAKLMTDGGTLLTSLQLKSGWWRDTVNDDYSYDSMLCWEISRPYPATMVAIGGYLQTQDA